MTAPVGTKATHIANQIAAAQARGITSQDELNRIAQEAADKWDSRLSRDPKTNLPL